jgi:hypothetical protein
LIANGILKSEVLMVQFIQKNKCEKYEQYEWEENNTFEIRKIK